MNTFKVVRFLYFSAISLGSWATIEILALFSWWSFQRTIIPPARPTAGDQTMLSKPNFLQIESDGGFSVFVSAIAIIWICSILQKKHIFLAR